MSLMARVERLESRGAGALHVVAGASEDERARKCQALIKAGQASEADIFVCVKRFAVEAAS